MASQSGLCTEAGCGSKTGGVKMLAAILTPCLCFTILTYLTHTWMFHVDMRVSGWMFFFYLDGARWCLIHSMLITATKDPSKLYQTKPGSESRGNLYKETALVGNKAEVTSP